MKAAEVARQLARRIRLEHHPVGTLLPTEIELCRQFMATRYAVRKALGELQEQGLISRRKNVGSRVESALPRTRFVQSLSSLDDLALFGKTNSRSVQRIEEVVADLEMAQEIGCPGGTRWLRITSLRHDSEDLRPPVAWLDIYVEPAYAGAAHAAQESPNTLISALIEAQYGRRIARVRQTVEAVGVTASQANALKAEVGSPALKIVRRYLDATNTAFEISVSVHPKGRMSLLSELKRAADT
jgi:GntR family transcriptional regulator